MSLIQKYIWVIKTIHRAGRITLKELNEKWRENIDLSRGENLPRQTFDPWKGGILDIYACDDYADFELTLRPTYDFYMKLMSFGNMIKVLEPKSLQEKICKWLDKTIEVYK